MLLRKWRLCRYAVKTQLLLPRSILLGQVLEAGKRHRASAPTLMNAESSRSHSILSVCVTQRNEMTQRVRRGKLVLVDLAGSEKVIMQEDVLDRHASDRLLRDRSRRLVLQAFASKKRRTSIVHSRRWAWS
jgi:hypothetical protein